MQIFKFATAGIKIHQIPHGIFGNKSQIFFKLCITLQCHKTKLFCIFSTKTLYALDKAQIFRLLTAYMKINQIPYLIFFRPQASIPLNLHHDSVSLLKYDMLWTKEVHQGSKFQVSNCSHEISLNLYFDRLLLLKVYKIQYRGVMSHDNEE